MAHWVRFASNSGLPYSRDYSYRSGHSGRTASERDFVLGLFGEEDAEGQQFGAKDGGLRDHGGSQQHLF